MRERWRSVRRCPARPCHKVSSHGRVRGPGGALEGWRDRRGRRRVELHGETVNVATVVLEAFDRVRPYGLEACHGPLGTVSDAVTNVRWGTHRENMKDKKRKEENKSEVGTYQSGSRTESEAGQQ